LGSAEKTARHGRSHFGSLKLCASAAGVSSVIFGCFAGRYQKDIWRGLEIVWCELCGNDR
ncbi:MAG: hypothetical protein VXV97_13870, partial [Pseudomonadota bacterium]|nr:hypothetical protein [Pseudomonadota bacterium]